VRGLSEMAFANEYLDMIGRRPSEAETKIADRNLGDRATDRSIVRNYIGTLNEFKDRYVPIVTRIYQIAKEHAPDRRTLDYFVNRFIDPEYTADNVVEDLESGVYSVIPETSKSVEDPPLNQTQAMMSFAGRWKKASGRKIDVCEFIRYYGQDLSDAEIRSISQRESDARIFVDKIHKDYLGRGVGADEFLELYVFDYDSSNFHNEVIASVLASDEYRNEMAKQLDKRYDDMFGQGLHPDDMEHILFQVRAKGLPLCSEEISDDLVRVNEQLKSIGVWADKIYEDVLRRVADSDDVRECVSEYRAYGDKEAEARLRRKLYQSLEYHDIVKEEIGLVLEKKLARSPSKREVFTRLAEVLKKHGKDMSLAIADLESD